MQSSKLGKLMWFKLLRIMQATIKGAGMIIEGQFPHVFWTPCVVHCLNLALKSICQPSSKLNSLTEF